MDGETNGDWELEAGGTGESGGSGLFSSCSISFSSFISPGGSTLYLSQEWPFTLWLHVQQNCDLKHTMQNCVLQNTKQ